jgi:hypothetical protein
MCNSASRGILVNEWTHVVGVVDAKGQLMEVYINGTLVKSCPYSRAGIRHGSFPLRVGGPFITLWDQSGLDGVLDEVRIYHRALTDDDVVSLFEGTCFVPNLAIRVSQIEVCWDTSTSYDYQLQYRSDLTTNVWVPLSTNSVRGTGGLVCMSDTVVPGQPHRYYRVAVTEHVP